MDTSGVDPVSFGKAFGTIVREALVPLRERLDTLEKALEALRVSERIDAEIVDEIRGIAAMIETRGLYAAGEWQAAQEYQTGAVVSFANSAWVATRAVPPGAKPSSKAQGWQLLIDSQPIFDIAKSRAEG